MIAEMAAQTAMLHQVTLGHSPVDRSSSLEYRIPRSIGGQILLRRFFPMRGAISFSTCASIGAKDLPCCKIYPASCFLRASSTSETLTQRIALQDVHLFYFIHHPPLYSISSSNSQTLSSWLQDRCAKNYYVFKSRASGKWMRVPWDMEDAFATDFRDSAGKVACLITF